MKRSRRNYKASSFSTARWATYLAAAGASALAGTPAAEGQIHYSGLIDFKFQNKYGFQQHNFLLSHGAILVGIRVARGGYGDSSATFELKGAAVSNAFRAYSSTLNRVNALPRGSVISKGHFFSNTHSSITVGRLQDYSCTFPGWQQPGTYYIGFRFNAGAGMQYGWVRIKFAGCYPGDNKYIVKDYAWGDPGDEIKTGQKQLHENETQVAPPAAESTNAAPLPTSDNAHPPFATSEGSLGLLALGAVGLQAWRRSRRVKE